jgi:hypothetical protein
VYGDTFFHIFSATATLAIASRLVWDHSLVAGCHSCCIAIKTVFQVTIVALQIFLQYVVL